MFKDPQHIPNSVMTLDEIMRMKGKIMFCRALAFDGTKRNPDARTNELLWDVYNNLSNAMIALADLGEQLDSKDDSK